MIEIVINYDPVKSEFKIYESSTDTLLVSSNLTEALVNLNHFLVQSGLGTGNILDNPDINYHLDSWTMKAMVESNANLIKQLKSGPSGFMLSSQRFGGSNSGRPQAKGDFKGSHNKFSSKNSSSFSGESGFKSSAKKFGGKGF